MTPRLCRIALLLAALCAGTAHAGNPDPARTRAYIDHAWTTLTRSDNDCAALADPKIKGRPLLYVPANYSVSKALRQTAARCKVDLRPLPRAIDRLGAIDASKLKAQGLLYLPHPYVVPGGFFNEMYGWDSYFIELGLIADQQNELARNMVDDALFEVRYYGGVLNANRSYYLSRSQPPLLSAMIADLLANPASFHDNAARRAWLAEAYPLAVRNYRIWSEPAHQAGKTGLARYEDLGEGPVLEAENSSYYVSVIRWLLAHPQQGAGYLIKGSPHPNANEAKALAQSSCDVRRSTVCADNWLNGYRLSAAYYHGDRAMRESGFDTNFHFGPFGGSTDHYAAVDLNALLYRYARDLHDFAKELGKSADAAQWEKEAQARQAAINQYLWQPQLGMYRDYDFTTGKPAATPYLTTFYPLWAGAASPQQAAAVQGKLPVFELPGGLSMSDDESGAQWDKPFGWAPTNWIAIAGLNAYGFHDDASRIAGKFATTVDRGFASDGTIREKYNMATASADVKISAGYTTNVIGFGWTNGVYVRLQQLLQDNRQVH